MVRTQGFFAMSTAMNVPMNRPVDAPASGSGVRRSYTFEIEPGKSGLPTLRAVDQVGQGFYIHSAYDPERTAADWARRRLDEYKDMPVVVLFGVGLGYEAAAVLSMLGKKQNLVLIEAEEELWKKASALEGGPLRGVLTDERVLAFRGRISKDFELRFMRLIMEARRHKVAMLWHPAAEKLAAGSYEEYVRAVRDAVNKKVRGLATVTFWSQVWPHNTLANLPRWIEAPSVGLLFGKMHGVPAILVSAGPSLNKNVHLLREAKGKFFIACVGTALKVLLREGIEPDLIVTFDGGYKNFMHFEGLDYAKIPMAIEPFVHPGIVENHSGALWCFEVNNPVARWFDPLRGDIARLGAGGSVAHAAFDLLVKVGFDPIAFVGQDLAFADDGRTHAQGTTWEWYKEASGGHGAQRWVEVPGYYGGTVYTNGQYESMLRWFEEYLAKLDKNRTIINATEGGAAIAGAKPAPLAEVIREYGASARGRDFSAELAGIAAAYRPPRPGEVAARLDEAVRELRGVAKRINEAIWELRQIKVAIDRGKPRAKVAERVRRFERIRRDPRIADLGQTMVGQFVLGNVINWHESIATAPVTSDWAERDRWVAERWLEIFEPLHAACRELAHRFEAAKAPFIVHEQGAKAASSSNR